MIITRCCLDVEEIYDMIDYFKNNVRNQFFKIDIICNTMASDQSWLWAIKTTGNHIKPCDLFSLKKIKLLLIKSKYAIDYYALKNNLGGQQEPFHR